jgi:hypothetical protein
MISSNRQNHNFVDQQQPFYMPDENSHIYAIKNNVPLTTNNEISLEQQIVYCNTPVNYPSINNPQLYVYPHELANSQIVNQCSSASLTAQHHQH